MKVRNGFVSNSSSSSFTCDICGATESGMDASARDLGFVTCRKGHTICEGHANEAEHTTEEKLAILKASRYYSNVSDDPDEIDDQFEEMLLDEGIPETECPICSMKTCTKEMILAFLLTKYQLTEKSVEKEIQNSYATYGEFEKSCIAKK